ncbi:MAG TPA: hypothetical protein VGJ00_05700 [Rhabdochlamydiaceae bacterium]|jgi:hypothetical protein
MRSETHEEYISLIKDTLAHLKEAAPDSSLAQKEEWEAFTPPPPPSSSRASSPQPTKPDPKTAPFLKNFPLSLNEAIPDDKAATRIMNAWEEYIGAIDVVVIACEKDEETLSLIKNLSKSIDQKLAKAKILSADRLEKEERWDLFLAKNNPKLILATAGFSHLKNALRYCTFKPVTSERLFGAYPLIILAPAAVYAQTPKEKITLWNQICSLLKA